MRRLVRAACLAALLVLGLTPARAGSASVAFDQVRAVTLAGQTQNGVFGVVLARFDVTQGATRFLYPPPQPSPPGMFAQYVGCLVFRTKKATDGGCNLRTPVTLELDPALSSGRVQVTVESKASPGKYITANLLLTGTGAPGPAAQNTLTPTLQPAPPNTKVFGLSALQLLTRPVDVIGTVRSDAIGGGPVTGMQLNDAYIGVTGVAKLDRSCLVALGGAGAALCNL